MLTIERTLCEHMLYCRIDVSGMIKYNSNVMVPLLVRLQQVGLYMEDNSTSRTSQITWSISDYRDIVGNQLNVIPLHII